MDKHGLKGMFMSIVKPGKLQQGDSIAIVAASFPLLPQFEVQYTRGLEILQRDLGFTAIPSSLLGRSYWWGSGTPEEVASDLNAQFADPTIRAVWSHTGGAFAYAVLPHLNYDLIAAHPKPLLGYSDITQYHLALYTTIGLVGFHVDCITDGLGGEWGALSKAQHASLRQLYLSLLCDPKPIGNIRPLGEWSCYREGSAEGRFLGGNLTRLTQLIGTPWFPPLEAFEEAIVFWEASGEDKYSIHAMLLRLETMGIFARIKGMVIGRQHWVNEWLKGIEYPSFREVVVDACKHYHFPILADVDF
jgi:muramoyltetrapeptide carboxypeptidase